MRYLINIKKKNARKKTLKLCGVAWIQGVSLFLTISFACEAYFCTRSKLFKYMLYVFKTPKIPDLTSHSILPTFRGLSDKRKYLRCSDFFGSYLDNVYHRCTRSILEELSNNCLKLNYIFQTYIPHLCSLQQKQGLCFSLLQKDSPLV